MKPLARLPRVLASTVVRSSRRGESHGALYLVDLENQAFELVVDWRETEIDWAGEGGDRGLRGIAFTRDEVLVAASNELLVFDRQLALRNRVTNPYLGQCHEITLFDNQLYLTSTSFDTLLELDLDDWQFVGALGIRLFADGQISYRCFDPLAASGPERKDTLHLNNVVSAGGSLLVSGRAAPFLFEIERRDLRLVAQIPLGTHNPRPFQGGVLLNDTEARGVTLLGPPFFAEVSKWFPAPERDESELVGIDPQTTTIPGFCRGLCLLEDGLFAAGSSPATVRVLSTESDQPLAMVELTNDVRHSIHGLEIWPFDEAPAES